MKWNILKILAKLYSEAFVKAFLQSTLEHIHWFIIILAKWIFSDKNFPWILKKKTFFHLIIHLEVGNPSWRNFSRPNPRCSTGFCNFWQSCSDNSMWMIMITVCQNCHFMIAVHHVYTTSSSLWVGFVWIGFTIFNSFRNLLKKKYKF